MTDTQSEPLTLQVARVLAFIVMGPVLINPLYSVSRWYGWVYSKTETALILLGCLLWAGALVALTEVLL